MRMKKFSSIVLALAIVLNLGSFSVFAEATQMTEQTFIEALAQGGNVTLANDVVVSSSVTIPEGISTVLDLNGCTLSGAYVEGSSTNHIYAITNYGELTIIDSGEDGEIVSRGVYNYGKLTLNAGTITACDENGGYAVNSKENATFVMNGGVLQAPNDDDPTTFDTKDATAMGVQSGSTATLYGGNVTGAANWAYAIQVLNGTLSVPKDSTVVVTGGHGAVATEGDGVTTIDGGTFICDGAVNASSDHVLYVNGTGKLTVNGGTFTNNNDDSGSNGAAVCTEGTSADVEINNGTFTGVEAAIYGDTDTVVVNGGSFDLKWENDIHDTLAQYVEVGTTITVDGTEMTKTENGLEEMPEKPAPVKPAGKLNAAYLSASYINGVPAIFGEATDVNAIKSFKVELYADGVLVGTTTLDDPKGEVIGKASSITWHAALSDDGDGYWKTVWKDGAINVNAIPDTAKLYVDDEPVDTCAVELNVNDLYKPVFAAVTDENGNVQSFVAGSGYLNGKGENAAAYDDALQSALGAGGNITLLRDVKISRQIKTSGKNLNIDGNGHKISGTGKVWLERGTFNVKNVVFDSIENNTNYGVLEFVYAQANVTGCTFNGNTAVGCIAVDANAGGNGTSNVVIDGCAFTGNNCGIAVIYSAEGTTTVKNSKITDNTVETHIIYNSANCTVNGNVFSDNVLTGTNAKKAAILTGPWVAGEYNVSITENVFLDEYVAVYVENWADKYNAVSTNNLSGNYWYDGNEPVADTDYVAEEGAAVTVDSYYTEVSEDNTVKQDSLVKIQQKPQGEIDHPGEVKVKGTYGEDSYREAYAITVQNIKGTNMYVELWSGETKLSTTTLRKTDRDDNTAITLGERITVNVVIEGDLSGSWDTEWHETLTVANVPDAVKVYVDGELVDEISGGAFYNDGELNKYLGLTGVYKAATVSNAEGKVVGYYGTLADAFSNVKENETITLIADEISEGAIKMPAELKNVTIKSEVGTVLKDMTIQSADGNSLVYEGLTFDGITFDNSNILITGWRNNTESYKDWTITNCTFKNVVRETSNQAAVHINIEEQSAINGFTFTNNTIDGVSGGSNSGVYFAATGEITITGNTINNVAFRPVLLQVSDCDGVVDTIKVENNTFSGSSKGRLQVYGSEVENEDGTFTPTGTDGGSLTITNNVFTDITETQQICCWGINLDNVETTVNRNYYDVSLEANASGNVFFNNKIKDVNEIVELGFYPVYTELNDDGTIDTNSEYTYAKPWDGVTISNLEELKMFRDAVNAGNNYAGKTVTLADDIDLSTDKDDEGNQISWTPIGTSSTPFNGTFDGNGKTISNLLITGNNSDVGLFGRTNSGAVKNLTINNAKVSGYLNVGALAGTPYTSDYSNIKLTGHVEINGFAYVGGVGGKNAYADWTDITVDVDETSYVNANSVSSDGTAYRTYVGGVIGFMGEGSQNLTNISSNIKVTGSTCDVGGIVGIAHYGNTLTNVSCSGAVEITNSDDLSGAKEIGGIAGVWHNGGTVTFEDCTFTGTISSTYTNEDGETVTLTENDFANGGLIGSAYSASGTGEMVIDYEAYIGTTVYETLADAFAAAKSGDVINLLQDISVTDQIKITDNDVLSNITLNGNGHTITADLDQTNESVLYFGDTGTGAWATGVEINDLTITGTARFAIALMGGTSSVLNNVKVEGDYIYGINLYGTHGAQMTSCDIATMFTNAQDDNPLNLVNTHIGTLYANKSDVDSDKGKITIGEDSTVDKLIFWGDNTKMIASGLDKVTTIEDSEGNTLVAEVGGVGYTNLASAIAAVESKDTLTLLADIDLEGVNWTPAKFNGATFEGNNKTIKNLTVTGTDKVGLFSTISNATINNLTLENVTSTGVDSVGTLAGYLANSTVTNVNVQGTIKVTANYKAGGLVGASYGSYYNCSVDGTDKTISYVKATHDGGSNEGDNVGGVIGHRGEGAGVMDGCSVKNITVEGTRKVGGMVGSAFQDNIYTNNTVDNVIVATNATVDYATDNQKTFGLGGLVGLYTANGNNDGKVENAAVNNVDFVVDDAIADLVTTGVITGGLRGTTVPTETAATMTYKDNTGTNVTGADNTYLIEEKAPEVEVEVLSRARNYIDYMPIVSYPANTTLYRLGLYSAADSTDYDEYGFEITVDGQNPVKIRATRYGETLNIVVGDRIDSYSASQFNYNGGDNVCIFGQTISFTADALGDGKISYRPYVVKDGITKWGYKFTAPNIYTK